MPVNLIDSLSAFGNANHLNGLIHQYEQGIEANSEVEKTLDHAPNYYAWLSSCAENVFYMVKEAIYANSGDHSIFNASYKKLLDRLFSENAFAPEQVTSILLFAKLRHIIVHKGFPNPHLAPSEAEKPIMNGVTLGADEVQSIAERYREPSSFPDLREAYSIAATAISSYKKEFVHDFGYMQISSKKER